MKISGALSITTEPMNMWTTRCVDTRYSQAQQQFFNIKPGENMNNENLLEQMGQLKMTGMQEAFREQQNQPKHADLSFDERLSLLLDREILRKDNNRVQTLQRRAKLRR